MENSHVLGLDGLRDRSSGRPAREVLDEIASDMRLARSVFVTSHINPDGDALGSEAALGLALRSLGKRVRVVNSDEVPARYRQLLPSDLYEVAGDSWQHGAPEVFDWAIVLDTSEPARTGALEPAVFASAQRRICIDHHLHRHKTRLFDHHLVVPEAASTANLVLELLDAIEVELTEEIARALWIALATDTGWFRFSNTNPWALSHASRLIAHGLQPEPLYEQIYGAQSVGRARLLGDVLRDVRLELDGDLLWSFVSRQQLAAHGVAAAELEGVIDVLKTVGATKVVAFVVELADNKYKVSLRSRGDVSVETIARSLGGGGHSKAAGCRYEGRLDDLIAALTSGLPQEVAARSSG